MTADFFVRNTTKDICIEYAFIVMILIYNNELRAARTHGVIEEKYFFKLWDLCRASRERTIL